MKYAFMTQQRGQYPVSLMCRVLGSRPVASMLRNPDPRASVLSKTRNSKLR